MARTIVFDRRRTYSGRDERDDETDSDVSDDEEGAAVAHAAVPPQGSLQPKAVSTSAKSASAVRRAQPSAAPARRAASATGAAVAGGAWQQPRKPAKPPQV